LKNGKDDILTLISKYQLVLYFKICKNSETLTPTSGATPVYPYITSGVFFSCGGAFCAESGMASVWGWEPIEIATSLGQY
jgi:hypothetical protein